MQDGGGGQRLEIGHRGADPQFQAGVPRARLPISVFIIAKNEADRIVATILSVRDWVEEVVVVDSGSTDGTVEVCQRLGARTVFNEWRGYGPQKIFGESLCRMQWVFNLDADEEVSPKAAEEIQKHFLTGGPLGNAVAMRFVNLFWFETKPNFIAVRHTYTRLYRKDCGGFKDSPIHDSVVMRDTARPLMLKHPILHRSHRSYAHMVEKINFYSSMQADDNLARGRRLGPIRILVTLPADFLKAYFVRGYIFYGFEGFVQSSVYAFARFLRAVKTRDVFRMEAIGGITALNAPLSQTEK